jgi:hypothetical protein
METARLIEHHLEGKLWPLLPLFLVIPLFLALISRTLAVAGTWLILIHSGNLFRAVPVIWPIISSLAVILAVTSPV